MAEQSGVWLDTKTNKIVTSRPEEGLQIQAPGVEPDQATIEAVKAALGADVEPATVDAVAPEAEAKPTVSGGGKQ